LKITIYTAIAIILWAIAAWLILDASADLMTERLVDDFAITLSEEGHR